VYAHTNETDCRNAHVMSIWLCESIVVDEQSPLPMQVSRCVYSTERNDQSIKDVICLSQSLMRV